MTTERLLEFVKNINTLKEEPTRGQNLKFYSCMKCSPFGAAKLARWKHIGMPSPPFICKKILSPYFLESCNILHPLHSFTSLSDCVFLSFKSNLPLFYESWPQNSPFFIQTNEQETSHLQHDLTITLYTPCEKAVWWSFSLRFNSSETSLKYSA